MYMDGTSHPIGVDDIATVSRLPRKEREPIVTLPLDGLYLPEMSHPVHILRDSFERQQAQAVEEPTYHAPEGSGGLMAGVFNALRDQLGPDLIDAISELEQAAQAAGGVPPAEHHQDSPVYHAFIEAYEQARDTTGTTPTDGVHKLLDTTG